MKSKRTYEFRLLFADLPLTVQQQAIKAFNQFQIDPDHPGLNFKPIGGVPIWYSVRIGMNYRAICMRADDAYVWLWIGSHANYDKFIKHRK